MTGFIILSFAVALVWHWLLPRFWLACFGAILTAILLFQIVAFVHAGYIDPFILVAVAVQFGLAFPITILVGYLYREAIDPQEERGTRR